MVLAAGLGLRMRPITENLPKPLILLAGRTLLDHALDKLQQASVETVTVNVHYLAHMIEDHLAARATPRILISDERDELLETGGGVTAALPTLGNEPFFVVNADIAWEDSASPALRHLSQYWRDDAMDALLLVQPVNDTTGYDGAGDYNRSDDGKLERRRENPSAPFVFTGVQLLHPRLFANAPKGAFSLIRLYDEAQTKGRLYGAIHDGAWHHIGTPAGFDEAEAVFGTIPRRSDKVPDGG